MKISMRLMVVYTSEVSRTAYFFSDWKKCICLPLWKIEALRDGISGSGPNPILKVIFSWPIFSLEGPVWDSVVLRSSEIGRSQCIVVYWVPLITCNRIIEGFVYRIIRIIHLLYRIKAWSTIFGSFFDRKVLIASGKWIAIVPFPYPV